MSSTEDHKKEKGIFYTPKAIAEYLINKSLLYYFIKDNLNNKNKKKSSQIKLSLLNIGKKIDSLRLLDPACGNGVFLHCTLNTLTNYILNEETPREEKFSRRNSLKKKLQMKILLNNLHGVDINRAAINEFKHNCANKIGIKNTNLSDVFRNFRVGNTIVDDATLTLKSFDWTIEFPGVMNGGGFDIIIGNPPWGAKLDNYSKYLEESYKIVAKGQYDSFAIFLYKAIHDLLKEDGILGFVIPNELCFLDQYKELRKYLLNFLLLEMINLGFDFFNVNKPALLLILKKSQQKDPRLLRKHNIFISVGIQESKNIPLSGNSRDLRKEIEKNSYYRKQDDFLNNQDYVFDIFANPKDKEIKSYLISNNFKPLEAYFKNGRGIDTNKKGEFLICPKCGVLNPPFGRGHSGRIKSKKCISNDCNFVFWKKSRQDYKTMELISEDIYPKDGYNAPCYIGEDLQKLHFSRPPRACKYYGNYLSNTGNRSTFKKYAEVQWGKHELYNGEKILIRKVSSAHNLQVMVHLGFLVTNQQIYIFKKRKKIKKISIYYFLGILASRMIYFYYINEFGDPEKNIFPHFTQSNIKKLPIPLVNSEDIKYKNLINIVKKIIDLLNNSCHKDIINRKMSKLRIFYNKLDSIVFEIYKIDDPETQAYITDNADKYGFALY